MDTSADGSHVRKLFENLQVHADKVKKKTQLLQEKLLGESPSEYSVKVLDAHQYFRCLI